MKTLRLHPKFAESLNGGELQALLNELKGAHGQAQISAIQGMDPQRELASRALALAAAHRMLKESRQRIDVLAQHYDAWMNANLNTEAAVLITLYTFFKGAADQLELDLATVEKAINEVKRLGQPPINILAERRSVVRALRRMRVAVDWLSQSRRGQDGGPSYCCRDEKDFQNLVYAILKPFVPDLLLEDPIGKVSGDSGRLDLSTRTLGLVIETKYALNPERAKRLASECREAIGHYAEWEGLAVLVLLVHDPQRLIPDPDNFIKGLAGRRSHSKGQHTAKAFDVVPIIVA